jgi:hypothetical protein
MSIESDSTPMEEPKNPDTVRRLLFILLAKAPKFKKKMRSPLWWKLWLWS